LPSRLRVPLGWAASVLVLWLARPTPLSLALGLPLALVGEAVRLWAAGHIEKTIALATGGPYAHTRNPLYVGSLLMATGVAVAAWSPWVLLAVGVYFLAFYPSVVREEARFLAEKFGAAYAAWAAAVPLFLPRLTPGGPRASRFEWARVRRNREWRTAVAVPLVALLLLVRWGIGS
jgi:protein-S-isoprenylcysteine O-methyltransferase Ste14